MKKLLFFVVITLSYTLPFYAMRGKVKRIIPILSTYNKKYSIQTDQSEVKCCGGKCISMDRITKLYNESPGCFFRNIIRMHPECINWLENFIDRNLYSHREYGSTPETAIVEIGLFIQKYRMAHNIIEDQDLLERALIDYEYIIGGFVPKDDTCP